MLIEEGYISLPYSPRMTEEQMRVARDTSDAKRFRDALAFVRAREGGRCAMSSIGNGCQGMDLEFRRGLLRRCPIAHCQALREAADMNPVRFQSSGNTHGCSSRA